ncbi:unnamed protein product, partial [Adineta ricciae]
VKLTGFQAYNDRLANLKRMAGRFDGNSIQRTDELLRSWDETHSRLLRRVRFQHYSLSTSSSPHFYTGLLRPQIFH